MKTELHFGPTVAVLTDVNQQIRTGSKLY